MNKKLKKILSTTLILALSCTTITSCATTNDLPDQKNPVVVGGYSTPITFDYLKDANISDTNNRIETIKNVASQNPSATIIVRYNSLSADKFSRRLLNIFQYSGYKTKLIGIADNARPRDVDVYIKFLPLDLINESGVQIKQIHGGCPSCVNKLYSSSPTKNVNITNLVNQ